MENLFDSMIEELEKKSDGSDEALIAALRAKRDEMGADASMEEMADAIQACLNAWYTEATGKEPPEAPAARDREFMQRTTATLQTFLGSVAWCYETITLQDDYALYEIDDLFDGVRLRTQIHVQTGPRLCRLSVIRPIMADAAL